LQRRTQIKPPKILVIEDNPADVTLLRYGLDQQGEEYELELLLDGAAAVSFVDEHRAGRRDPDPCVILLDLHLPKYDGMEVLRAIKRAPVLAHIRVVVMTGCASPNEEADILALGAICRQKPSELSRCLELAAEILAICKGSVPEETAPVEAS